MDFNKNGKTAATTDNDVIESDLENEIWYVYS